MTSENLKKKLSLTPIRVLLHLDFLSCAKVNQTTYESTAMLEEFKSDQISLRRIHRAHIGKPFYILRICKLNPAGQV